MKQLFNLLLFLGLPLFTFWQVKTTNNTDSLIAQLKTAKPDTGKVNLLISISKAFASSNPENAVLYGKQAATLAKQLHWQKGFGNASNAIGNGLCNLSNFDEALKSYSIAFKISDSLKDKLAASNALSNMGLVYTYQGNYEKALQYNLDALQLRTAIGDEKSIANSCNNIGALYESQGNLSQALNYYKKSLQAFTAINYLQGMSAGYHNIGSIYREQGNFPEGLQLFLSALKIDEQLQDTASIAMDYSSIGILYQSHKDYAEALQNHLASIKLFGLLQNKFSLAVEYSDAGATYLEMDSLETALRYYTLSFKKGTEIGDSVIIAKALANIGQVYFDMHNFKLAIDNYNSALQIYNTTVTDTISLAALYTYIATLYLAEKQWAQAESNASKALVLANKTGSLTWAKSAHEILAGVYENTGRFKDAILHYKAFEKAKDSLFNEDNTKKIVQAQMQYDFDKKQLLADAAYKKQAAVTAEKHRAAILLGITIATALLAISFISFYFYRRFEKNKFRLQMAEIRQEALVAQLDTHFISDTIVSINNYIVNNNSNAASKYLLGFGALIRNTLQTSFKKTVTVQEETEFVTNYLNLAVLQYPQANINYSLIIAQDIDITNTLMPPMVLQVLVENAVRHAFTNDKGGSLKINIQKENNTIYCRVDDNGRGRQAASQVKNANRPSYGSSLAEKLLDTWSDTFGKTTYTIHDLTDVDNVPSGTSAEFSFPFIEK